MLGFEEFEQLLRDALAHLYDPAYRPPEMLRALITPSFNPTPQQCQDAMIRAIERLRPATDVPHNARSRRLYELLANRYVQELTQEETAERLGITPRHLRREQQAAVRMLAQALWDTQAAMSERTTPAQPSPISTPGMLPDADAPAWRVQVQQELAALIQSDPHAVADVGVVLDDVRRLTQRLAEAQGIDVRVEVATATTLMVRMHPSLLRQLVITAVQKLLTVMSGGSLVLTGDYSDDMIRTVISGSPFPAGQIIDSEFMRESLAAFGGQVEIDQQGEQHRFCITLPYQPSLTVLVVDDNLDLVHFYRRYTERTRYTIVHTAHGREVFDLVSHVLPDLIVLDVMLPDIDGWEVLTRLHENPLTRAIPVIVCSVIRQEELALALGAHTYLAKPVRRQEFIQTLDRVSAQIPVAG